MNQENFRSPESNEGLTDERKLEIAIAYIKDEALRSGKTVPHFNSPEMRTRIKNTIEQKYLSEASVTEKEAMEFLREILGQ
ncbi:MAG TPA: hypothetical protein PKA60_01175 [Candidatus Paceibacterota bacterium]|nr:hypothetical protein [Candidatus Paceibacterota bacterium]